MRQHYGMHRAVLMQTAELSNALAAAAAAAAAAETAVVTCPTATQVY